jgi:CRISPR-associated protein Cas2
MEAGYDRRLCLTVTPLERHGNTAPLSRFVLVTYDIRDDKRRTKVANELKNYGTRVQYSVFECLPDEQRDHGMRRRVSALINQQEDSVRYYRLCEACRKNVEVQGSGEVTEDTEVWIV